MCKLIIWAASSEFGTYRLCEQRRFRRACASAQSRQNLRYSLIQAESQEEPSDRKPDPWPIWMAVHAQLKFVMTESSKTQIRLTRLIYKVNIFHSKPYIIIFVEAQSPIWLPISEINCHIRINKPEKLDYIKIFCDAAKVSQTWDQLLFV